MDGVGERKQRVDKKIDVKATVSVTFKMQLYDFAYLCNEPVKSVAERLIIQGMTSRYVMEGYSRWLRRDFICGKTIGIGHLDRPKLKVKTEGETDKVSMRFEKYHHDRLSDLAYALDITASSTAAILLRLATKESEFMHRFINNLDVDDTQKMKVWNFAVKAWGIK